MNYNLAIVDDHPLFREGFKSIIKFESPAQKVMMLNDGKELIELLNKDTRLDLVFMDILMPIMDGITATKRVKQYFPDIKIIAFSSLESIEYVEKMIEAGVDGYILKEASPDEIFKAMTAVMLGNNYFSSKVIITLSRKTMQRIGYQKNTENFGLSPRELQVLKLLCAGLTRKEIGDRLFISERTVDKHKENILSKTKCKNLMRLVFFSLKNNLIDTDLLDQIAG